MKRKFMEQNPEFDRLLIATASSNREEREVAQEQFAQAITTPLRQGVLYGDNNGGIFTPMKWAPGTQAEFPLDILAPGEEDEWVAFTSPGAGYIPQKRVSGNYVSIPTYNIAHSVDWELKFARQAQWDVVNRAIALMEAGMVRKKNNDAWHTILSAAVDRNILVYDADASAGQFTKRLVSLAKSVMSRNAGGNATSVRRGRLTDIFISIEGVEDIRNWNLDQVDEVTRREIYLADDSSDVILRIFGVNIHPMYEFGEGQEYQNYFTGQLAGNIQGSDSELAIGLDLSSDDSFVMPFTMPMEVFADPSLHRQQLAGYYCWQDMGFGVLDSRRVLALSF